MPNQVRALQARTTQAHLNLLPRGLFLPLRLDERDTERIVHLHGAFLYCISIYRLHGRKGKRKKQGFFFGVSAACVRGFPDGDTIDEDDDEHYSDWLLLHEFSLS